MDNLHFLPDPLYRSFEERYDWDQNVAPLLKGKLPASMQQQFTRKGIRPASTEERSGNELRPVTFDGLVGQQKAKHILSRMVDAAKRQNRPLDHALFIGPSGTGKTTLANICAHELGRKVIQLEAPVSADTLAELAEVMEDGDILFLDEVHQQAASDRRGRSSNTQPEVLFSIMEDRTLPTGQGIIQFPHITIFGATTDEGALPDAFINRFPIRPILERYGEEDMRTIALRNAAGLRVRMAQAAARSFARASRGVPREVNNYMRIASQLAESGYVSPELALEVLSFVGVSEDGLTRDMQAMLTFLYTRAKRLDRDGEVKYQASVGTIATAIGKGRDRKAIALRVEPWLIEKGYVQVGHGGRALTQAGVVRARALLEGVE